jgi:hypothetical protein
MTFRKYLYLGFLMALLGFGAHAQASAMHTTTFYSGGACSDCGAPTTSGGNCTGGCK